MEIKNRILTKNPTNILNELEKIGSLKQFYLDTIKDFVKQEKKYITTIVISMLFNIILIILMLIL